MDYAKINKSVMDDTQDVCGKLNSLKSAIASSVEREYVVYKDDEITANAMPNADMKIVVSGERTFAAAEKYKGKKICCLDFANSHSVGGAPWSAGAQEESMCRVSTLYPCLYAKKQDFYDLHCEEYDAGEIDEMGTDEELWFKTDVIVSAAPELDWGYDDVAYKKIMESRIKRILDVASNENVQVLILGAFGCGAFNNPPEIVSEIFSGLVRKYGFETVEFAVFCNGDTTNFDVFKRRFAG